MNPSISRLLVTLPLSIVLSLGLVLLTWSINDVSGTHHLFNFGILYAMGLMSFLALISVRKITAAEKNDYTQDKIDLMLDGILMEAKMSATIDENESIDDVDFDYSHVQTPTIPSPEVDKSLRF